MPIYTTKQISHAVVVALHLLEDCILTYNPEQKACKPGACSTEGFCRWCLEVDAKTGEVTQP